MKKVKRKIVLLVSILGILALISSYSVYAAGQVSNNIITIEDAEKAASYYFGQYGSRYVNWLNASVSNDPVIYYSVNNSPTAYEFTVKQKDGTASGFLIISATKEWIPLLEFSDGKPPSNYLSGAKAIAVDGGFISKEENKRFLYWGGLTYSVQFGNEMMEKNLAIHLPTGVLQEVPLEFELQMDKEKAMSEWNELIGGNTRGVVASLMNIPTKMLSVRTTTVTISGVPA